MFVLRFISWVCVAIALMLLGADAVSSVEEGQIVMRSVPYYLSLMSGEGGAAAYVDAVPTMLSYLLASPAWAALGALGVVLVLLFRPID